MTWTVARDGHLFVYWRGRLIYKRWDDRGYAALFDPYGMPRYMIEDDAMSEDEVFMPCNHPGCGRESTHVDPDHDVVKYWCSEHAPPGTTTLEEDEAIPFPRSPDSDLPDRLAEDDSPQG